MATFGSRPDPNDLITYKYENRLVYVRPASNFDEAIDFAQKVYPELSQVARDRILFAVNVGATGQVIISEFAWTVVVQRLKRAEIVNVLLCRDPHDPTLPPQYIDVPKPSSTTSQPDSTSKTTSTSDTSSKINNKSRKSWLRPLTV